MSSRKEVVMFSFDARDRGGSREWMRAWSSDEVDDKERAEAGEERKTWEAEMAALWASETERRRPLEEAGKGGGTGPASR
jgi:hypothetical protein